MQSLWSFSLWHRLWSLLHLDVLFVGEHAQVVHHLVGESAIAIFADFWLGDFTALNVLAFFALALGASESGFFHFWGGVRSSDDNTFQGDELVNVPMDQNQTNFEE